MEWFNFMVYLALAPVLARVVFAPEGRLSLLLIQRIFAAAFLARPLASLGFIVLSDPLYLLLASGDLVAMLVAAIGFVILAACFMGLVRTAVMEHSSTEVCIRGIALRHNAGADIFGGATLGAKVRSGARED